jgi:hypothetical protein
LDLPQSLIHAFTQLGILKFIRLRLNGPYFNIYFDFLKIEISKLNSKLFDFDLTDADVHDYESVWIAECSILKSNSS